MTTTNIHGLRPASVGSVSHGTMRTEDLIESFWNELEWLINRNERNPENMETVDKIIAKHGEISDRAWNDDGELCQEYLDSEDVNYDLESLFDLMDLFSPAYCYFGAHAGDGSDYGFWPCQESINDLPKYADSADADADAPHDADYAVVNDHGNVTIYSADGSIVAEFV